MPIEIIVPRLGWSMEEGAFVAWLKRDGEFVCAGDPLFSIEGDKAIQEIESIDSGILRRAVHGPRPGDSIRVGDVLGHLVPADEPAPAFAPGSAAGAGAEVPSSQAQSVAASTSSPARVGTGRSSEPKRRPAISPRALRVAAELGVDWTTVTGTGRTGRIRERDVRAVAGSEGVVP